MAQKGGQTFGRKRGGSQRVQKVVADKNQRVGAVCGGPEAVSRGGEGDGGGVYRGEGARHPSHRGLLQQGGQEALQEAQG